MSKSFRDYAAETMKEICDGAMSGGIDGDVSIHETYMAPGQSQGKGPVVFDFEGTHADGTKVMGEVVFRQFDIEPGDCKQCGTFVDDYGDKLCYTCGEGNE